MFSVTLQVIGLEEIMAGLNGAGPRLLEETKVATEKGTLLLEGEIKADTPRRSGHLFASIQGRVRELGGATEGHVGTSLAYALDVEFDTAAHVIEAKNGALMLPIAPGAGTRWKIFSEGVSIFGGATKTGRPRSGQQVAFFKKVHHPGTKGQHMFSRGLQRARPAIEDFFREAVRVTLHSVRSR